MSKDKDLVAVQDPDTGKFLPGKSGNPKGRPVGSKNKITVLKATLEQEFREDNYEAIAEILRMILDRALDGDKYAQKLVWDAAVSKGISTADKEAKTDKGFTVHHMHHDVNDKGKNDG